MAMSYSECEHGQCQCSRLYTFGQQNKQFNVLQIFKLLIWTHLLTLMSNKGNFIAVIAVQRCTKFDRNAAGQSNAAILLQT